MWFLHNLAKHEARYNGSRHFRLSGPVNRDALERAVASIVQRHDVLRTSFASEGGRPVPLVHERGQKCFEYERVDPEFGGRALYVQLAAQRRRPFDLSRHKALRVTLQELAPDDHLLHVVYHQIAIDEPSVEILLDELGVAYRAQPDGADVDLDPASQMAESVVTDTLVEEHREFWLSELADAAPHLDLSAHRPPSEHQHEGRAIECSLEPALSAEIRRLADDVGTEASTVFLVMLALLLGRWGDCDDVVLGTPFSMRDDGSERVVGPLENPLPVRVRFPKDRSLREVLLDVAERRRHVAQHAALPFADLVREMDRAGSADANPLFGVHFRSRIAERQRLDLGTAKAVSLEPKTLHSRYELELAVSEERGGLSCSFLFSKDRFDNGPMEEFVRQYEQLLHSVFEAVDTPARHLPLEQTSAAIERARHVNATAMEYPRDQTLGSLFLEAVDEHGDLVAIADGEDEVTFDELRRKALRAAYALERSGVMAGDFVGILVRPDVATVTAMVATVLVGAAYVPLDPDLPAARLREINEDARATVIMGDSAIGEALDLGPCTVIDLAEIDGDQVHNTLNAKITAHEPAYMIYTSGSTGQPKGVVVPHRSAVRQLVNSDFLPLAPGDVVGQVSNLAFDVSVIEVWGPLLNGARIEMIPAADRLEPRRLVDFIRRRGVTVLFLSSLHFNAVIRDVPDALSTLDTFMVGADVVQPAPVRRALSHGGPKRFINAYGPTEASVWCCFAEITSPPSHRKDLPIGRPASNNSLYVLNAAGGLAAPWEPGELCVGGDGVALGYWQQSALTAEKFVPDPFAGTSGARMYLTGDRVVQSVDGEFHFLGRLDRQVKIRGNRVELGEIEAKMSQLQGVDSGRVAITGTGASQQLVGYITKSADSKITSDVVMAELAKLLPGYMVPHHVMVLDALPTNHRGKIDMKLLPTAPVAGASDLAELAEPPSRLEAVIAQCFAEVLDLESVRRDVDFFALGGHSLIALELLSRIEERLGLRISLVSFMRYSSVLGMVGHIESLRAVEDGALNGVEHDGAGQIEPIVRLVSSWVGTRANSESLLVQRNLDGGGRPLYWCFQGERDLDGLAQNLGAANPIIGMRSAFGVCEPMSDMIPALARRYAEEIVELDDGPYVLGGDCAGAEVAFAMAWELERMGREVELLIIMERVIDAPYPGDVLLLYGRESQMFNPYLNGSPSDEVFERNYGSYRVDTVGGDHGRAFLDPYVEELSTTLRRFVNDPFVDPHKPPRSQAREPGPPAVAVTESSPSPAADLASISLDVLPPGDLARIDHGEHLNRRFLFERAATLGPIFKGTTSGDRLVVCVVGFRNCKRLLREHARQLGPNSMSLGGLFPKGIIREMHGADHGAYRGPLIRALAGSGASSTDAVVRRTSVAVLNELADVNSVDPQRLAVALDVIATSTLVEIVFGVQPGSSEHNQLLAGFKKLGPDGLVWIPESPQEEAFADLRDAVWELAERSGEGSASSVLRRMAAQGDLDETSLGNLIYMVELGRFDMASLMRWLIKLGADHPSTLEDIRSADTSEQRSARAEAFVLETFRLHQSERLMRYALEDLEFDGYVIPKGTVVRLCLWESHKDETNFSDPFEFDPSRFLGETFTSDHFAPFGLGGRRCPASDLAVALAAGFVTTMASDVQPSMLADGPPIHGAWHWEPSPDMKVGWVRVPSSASRS